MAEKALDWEGHYVDILAGEQFSDEYLRINPKAVVPVLVHDGRVIPESTVICEYLEDAFPETPIFPADAFARARVRLWTRAVDEELHPACSALTYIVSHRYTILRNGIGSFEDFLAAGGTQGRAARERKWRWIQQGIEAPGAAEFIHLYMDYLDKMEQALEASQWLVGDTLSMADIAMAPYLFRLDCLAMDNLWADDRLPNVARWYRDLKARASFKAAFVDWMPQALAAEMQTNGEQARPGIEALRAARLSESVNGQSRR